MMTTWSIQLNPAVRQQPNDVLSLRNQNQSKHFRSWFGALAGEIYQSIRVGLNLPLAKPKALDKTEAQHILIQAAMVQQHCMQYYRVYADLKLKHIDDLALHDLLLFIRMANYHPNQQDLIHYQQHSHVIESSGHLQSLLNQLQQQQLIQRISTDDKIFYDKNPYPHCHLLDTETGRISDYDCQQPGFQDSRYQRLPCVLN